MTAISARDEDRPRGARGRDLAWAKNLVHPGVDLSTWEPRQSLGDPTMDLVKVRDHRLRIGIVERLEYLE
ncbi:MAG TPA: hypothetical protein VMH38_00555 [Thermoplasmata archaeon]|nr:hypothetical protein [Thermoplasmata archaeon]